MGKNRVWIKAILPWAMLCLVLLGSRQRSSDVEAIPVLPGLEKNHSIAHKACYFLETPVVIVGRATLY